MTLGSMPFRVLFTVSKILLGLEKWHFFIGRNVGLNQGNFPTTVAELVETCRNYGPLHFVV
jgi:hypothetical protein